MATYPGIIKNRGIRSTTIVTANNVATGQKGRILSAAMTSSATTRITPEDVQDPSRLTKALNDIQQAQDAQTQASRSNPHSSPYIARDLSWGIGETKVIPHTLSRPYVDWWATRPRVNHPQLTEVALPSTSYPGITPERAIVLTNVSGVTFTCNLTITGD